MKPEIKGSVENKEHSGNKENQPGLTLDFFLKELDAIKQKYRITHTLRLTPDTEARRIAILATDCFLKHGGDINKAGFLERKIYEAVKLLDLTCAPIPEEEKAKELSIKGRKSGTFHQYNPLKLAIEGKENYLTTYTPLMALIIRKLNTREEKKDAREHTFKNRGLNQRRTVGRILQGRAFNHKKMEDRKRTTLREVG